jgi:hypothetical protein
MTAAQSADAITHGGVFIFDLLGDRPHGRGCNSTPARGKDLSCAANRETRVWVDRTANGR